MSESIFFISETDICYEIFPKSLPLIGCHEKWDKIDVEVDKKICKLGSILSVRFLPNFASTIAVDNCESWIHYQWVLLDFVE